MDDRRLRVLHVLPHRGGGAETYIDLLEGTEGFVHARVALSAGRTAAAGAASIVPRYPRVARRVLGADIVHVHGDAATMLSLPLLMLRPSVWTTHGLHLLRRVDGPARALSGRALRRAIATTARTICTSQAERDELAALLGADAGAHGRLRVVRNGIATLPAPSAEQRSAARAEFDLRSDELAVLFLGELDARKRPLDAIAATERARLAGAPVVLLVAGDGPQRDAAAARASDWVRVLGQVRDITALLNAADVLVMPSEREGLSFAVLEAMGAGLALVVSDGPGNPEAVGEAGLVLALGDVPALADALVRLAGDRDELRRLGAAARARVTTTLTAARLRDGVADAYRDALGRSPSA
jgi:glycosyltransferase involved in cell wall biosynthesis